MKNLFQKSSQPLLYGKADIILHNISLSLYRTCDNTLDNILLTEQVEDNYR